MNIPCSTKTNNYHIPHWTFQELYKAKVTIYLSWVKCKDEDWMNQNLKLTAGILLVYIQEEIYFLNKQCKRKIP